MSIQIVAIVAALVIAWLIFLWSVNVVKTSIGTAFKIAIILLVLQLVFAISPQEIGRTILDLPRTLRELLGA